MPLKTIPGPNFLQVYAFVIIFYKAVGFTQQAITLLFSSGLSVACCSQTLASREQGPCLSHTWATGKEQMFGSRGRSMQPNPPSRCSSVWCPNVKMHTPWSLPASQSQRRTSQGDGGATCFPRGNSSGRGGEPLPLGLQTPLSEEGRGCSVGLTPVTTFREGITCPVSPLGEVDKFL